MSLVNSDTISYIKVANLTITCCCLLFISFLAIMYFSKKNMQNLENKIYKHLLAWSIINLVAYLINISSYFLSKELYQNEVISLIVIKLTGCATVIWFTYFLLYIQVVTKQHKKKKSLMLRNPKISEIFIKILMLVLGIIAFALPLDIFYEGSEGYAMGVASIYYWMTSTFCVLVSVISLLVNIRKVNFKKVFPLLLITIL